MESPDETRDEHYIQSKPLETFNQEELNDLVRDLELSKAASELLASRLYQKILLAPFTKISYYRDREQQFYHILLKLKIVFTVVTLRAC